MRSKVKFYHYWDWKTIGITVSVLIGLLVFMLFIFFHNELIRSYQLSQLDLEITGVIIKIDEQRGMRQSKYGNYGVIDHYVIWYTYQINGITYTQKNWIDGNKRIARWINKIKQNSNKTIQIKFDSKNPKKSMIVLN